MGVPTFFKWLNLKYPKILIEANGNIDQANQNINLDNANLYDNENNQPQVDNLYLDMNAIIHICCNSKNRSQPANQD